jgi:hypothetical protein
MRKVVISLIYYLGSDFSVTTQAAIQAFSQPYKIKHI